MIVSIREVGAPCAVVLFFKAVNPLGKGISVASINCRRGDWPRGLQDATLRALANAMVEAIMKMRLRLSESPRRADSNNIDEFIVGMVVNELL